MSEEIEEIKLTGKQKLFAKYYIGECSLNATRAAKLAGYKGNDNTLSAVGFENLRKPKIRTYIDEQLESVALSKSEVLAILTKQAKGSLADVLDENGEFDLADAKRRGVDGLMKEIEIKERVLKSLDEIEVLSRTYKYKIHDSQSAAVHIGKAHGMFIDRHEHKIKNVSDLPDEELLAIVDSKS